MSDRNCRVSYPTHLSQGGICVPSARTSSLKSVSCNHPSPRSSLRWLRGSFLERKLPLKNIPFLLLFEPNDIPRCLGQNRREIAPVILRFAVLARLEIIPCEFRNADAPDRLPRFRPGEGGVPPPPIDGDLRMHSVCFDYTADKKAYKKSVHTIWTFIHLLAIMDPSPQVKHSAKRSPL